MGQVSALPQGFATGTANGQFISVEAPNMGPLPIRATIIHVTNGPTHSWAAVYTKNKVLFAAYIPLIGNKKIFLSNTPHFSPHFSSLF
jgi:hypothetical protein